MEADDVPCVELGVPELHDPVVWLSFRAVCCSCGVTILRTGGDEDSHEELSGDESDVTEGLAPRSLSQSELSMMTNL